MTLIIALVLLFIGVIAAFVVPWDSLLARRFTDQAHLLRVRLLSNTDHQVLLEAGREVLSQVPKDYLGTNERRAVGDLPLPKGVRIPQGIRDLEPRGIVLSYDGYLTIEMHGGMDHFGVCVYPEDFQEPHPGFKYGDRELLTGLWYYDENYRYGAEYDKVIGEMLAGKAQAH